MSLSALDGNGEAAGTLAGCQDTVLQTGRFKDISSICTRDFHVEDLVTGRGADFFIAVEDEDDFLVRQHPGFLHGADCVNGNQDAALAVNDAKAVSHVIFIVQTERILFCIATVENCIQVGIQNDLAIRVFRLQAGNDIDAIAFKVMMLDVNSLDFLQQAVNDFNNLGIAFFIAGAAVDRAEFLQHFELFCFVLGSTFSSGFQDFFSSKSHAFPLSGCTAPESGINLYVFNIYV